MASKVFGYQRFPSKLFELDTDEDAKSETQKQQLKMLEADPTLAQDENFMARNNTYAVIPPVTVLYNTRAQTSLFRNVFTILQENNTKETFFECSFDHFNCKLTRIEHFIHDVYLIFNPLTNKKKKRGIEIEWLSESFVQRFYNQTMTFREFGDSLLNIFDFKSHVNPEMIALCWTIYHREIFFRISGNTLVTQLEDDNLRKLFEIFTHLDNNVVCTISPFLMNQFLTWWISESGIKLNKEVQSLAEWFKSAPKDACLDFPEFIKQVYRLFLSGTPCHIYKSLIVDAWECIVSGVIKKGLLEKVGPNKGRWLPRVMYLHVDRIEYFKRKSDGSLEMKGVINLGPKSSVTEVFNEDKLGYFQMSVVCSESRRKYLLRADDQRIRHIWKTSIQNVLDVMKGATKPLVLEKPLKFVQGVEVEGELSKLRSFSTNDSGVNTLNGNQLIFKKRHSDDFSKHFKIEYSAKLPRSSSFTKVSPGLDLLDENPRISVASKASTMSECMDLTTSPHPGSKTIVGFFRNSNEAEEFGNLASISDEFETDSKKSASGSSCDKEYESMSNSSCLSPTTYVVRNLSNSLLPSRETNDYNLLESHTNGLPKSLTIDDNLHRQHGAQFSPEPMPRVIHPQERPQPIAAPRRKAVLSTHDSLNSPDLLETHETPKLPPRRMPKAPERMSSKLKYRYENAQALLNKL